MQFKPTHTTQRHISPHITCNTSQSDTRQHNTTKKQRNPIRNTIPHHDMMRVTHRDTATYISTHSICRTPQHNTRHNDIQRNNTTHYATLQPHYHTAQRNTTPHIIHHNTPYTTTYHSLTPCVPTLATARTRQHIVVYHIATYTNTVQHINTTSAMSQHHTPQRHTTRDTVLCYDVCVICAVRPVDACWRGLLCYCVC